MFGFKFTHQVHVLNAPNGSNFQGSDVPNNESETGLNQENNLANIQGQVCSKLTNPGDDPELMAVLGLWRGWGGAGNIRYNIPWPKLTMDKSAWRVSALIPRCRPESSPIPCVTEMPWPPFSTSMNDENPLVRCAKRMVRGWWVVRVATPLHSVHRTSTVPQPPQLA